MGQDEHRHNDVFGDRRLVAEDVADCDPFRDRCGVEQVESSRNRLQQAKARCGGKSARQIWPTTISASVSNGAACTASASSSRIEVSKGVVTLARIRGATVAAKWPRNRALIRCSNLQTTVEGLSPFNHYSRQAKGDFL